jgi:hypothetical protein
VKIPPSNLQPDYPDEARAFANQLADGLQHLSSEPVSAPLSSAPDGQTQDPVTGSVA